MMKITDKGNKQEEQWQLGDVFESNSGDIGILIKDDSDEHAIMPITGDYAYRTLGNYELDFLPQDEPSIWHKVKAELFVED